MRKLLITTTIAAIVVALPNALAAEPEELRYTIAVSKFENRSGHQWYWGPWNLGDAWGAVMTDMLNQSGRFVVLGEPDMRAEAMAEQDLATSGSTVQGSRTPVSGQMTPAQLLVKGVITHAQHSTTGGGGRLRIKGFRVGGKKDTAVVNVTVYVVDSTTGQVVATTNVVGESDRKSGTFGYSGVDFGGDIDLFKSDNRGKAVEAAVDQSVGWIVDQLPRIPWAGSVALVQDGKIYVNRGRREGVVVGQDFVVGSVEAVRDPETGELLDESMTEVARVRAEEVKEKVALCSITSGDAAGVERGMRVDLP